MFTKKSHADVKKSTLKIQDCKKDASTRLRHLKTILDIVDVDEAKSVFETNYSHVYFILYDTFVQAEANLKQRVHKAHREELDNSLWLLEKLLCLLPELLARRWQCHSLGRIMAKLLHAGNSIKLRKEGVRYFLLWYQCLGENAPNFVNKMFADLVPGLFIPQKSNTGPSDLDFNISDYLNHPNMRGEIGGSVFHDACMHPVQNVEIFPLLPPPSNERTAAPDPRDGLEVLLNSLVQTVACLKWRDSSIQKHLKTFAFLLQRFKDIYLPVFCPRFDYKTSIYEPKLDLPTIRSINKREELMSSCIVVLVNWISKYTHEKLLTNRIENFPIDDELSDHISLLSNLKYLGFSQGQIVRDVLYSTRENINFVHEVYRQAFLLNFTSKSQIESMRTAIAVYREWMTSNYPPFLLEPDDNVTKDDGTPSRNQRLRTDSYLGAILKENLLIRAGLQNVLQVFITNAANVFLVQTGHLNIVFPSKSRDYRSSPINEQTDICKKVLNVYRTMVMNTRMEPKTWEQLLLVLLQITSLILNQNNLNETKLNNLGCRLGQALFQTLIVTWIRAHTNVPVKIQLWEKFLNVLTSLTHREELIIEWDKTMQTLTRVLARYVYNINLQDLPLDRLIDAKGKRKRLASIWQQNTKERIPLKITDNKTNNCDGLDTLNINQQTISLNRSIPTTPSLNRSYSEGSLAPSNKIRIRRRRKGLDKVPVLPSNVKYSLDVILSNKTNDFNISLSSETLNTSRIINMDCIKNDNLRRVQSLDSIQINKKKKYFDDDIDSNHDSRSQSPSASSGLDNNSMKDSPIQLDVLACDTSSIDINDDINCSLDRRPIILGGTASGWLPDVAAIMWKRMLGTLGDINLITKSDLHAQVFKYLVDMTINLIKIKQNQGITIDNNQSSTNPSNLTPPIGIIAPWCYCALNLDSQFKKGKLLAVQLLCILANNGAISDINNLPIFYTILHRILTGEDRDILHIALKYLCSSRFFSLQLPGCTLLLLDLVHSSAVVLTSSEVGKQIPRSEITSLLGSLLCFPSTLLPNPVLQPSENLELMECPDIQDHVLNIVLRCARREPSSSARCIALSYLGQWLLQKLSRPTYICQEKNQKLQNFKYNINYEKNNYHSRIEEVLKVLLQALQFKHRTIVMASIDALKLCAERGKELASIPKLSLIILTALSKALEIQNIEQPKEKDKMVLTSLMLCLGEFCMAFPVNHLFEPINNDNKGPIILEVLNVLHQLATGCHSNRIKLISSDEDFDMTITMDDVIDNTNTETGFHTKEITQNLISAISLCAKAVGMHLITHLAYFPMGIGPSRLSSLVEEQDDLNFSGIQMISQDTKNTRDSFDLSTPHILNAQNIQILMLDKSLVASFIELPALKMPGGGITAGLVTADKQVRILLRDLNGKNCWDASILYREPKNNTIRLDDDSGINLTSFHDNIITFPRPFLIGGNNLSSGYPLDPLTSTINIPIIGPPRHTLRHRQPHELPIAKDLAHDLDQLDDLLQYIGFTSPECLSKSSSYLNTPGPSPLGAQLEAQTISIILNQRAIEQEYVQRQNIHNLYNSEKLLEPTINDSLSYESINGSLTKNEIPFQYCRLLFSHLGLAGWERRNRTHLLKRTEKLLRELRNVDIQKCRETHKVAVIYVANGQEDKNSILKNSYGSSTYEMFISALGWEIDLETHTGFLGGLPRQGCGSTAPYFATPFLEVIYHVATRMPSDTPESILTKTRHLGNDEVHIVWSEHYREYRRDILPTEFCDVLITIYPLKNGLFRITISRKQEVSWFGPLVDENVVSGASLASLVRATAINASRAKRFSMPYFQQYFEERSRSLETVSSRYKDNTTFEDFVSRIYCPTPNSVQYGVTPSNQAPLAAALIDHQRNFPKGWCPQPETKELTNTNTSSTASNASIESQSPRPLRKLHPFKSVPRKSIQQQSCTPPESPTFPGRKFK